MNFTRADFAFWQSKQPRPAWAEPFQRQAVRNRSDLLEACINGHAGIQIARNEMAAGNLLGILRLKRNHLLPLEFLQLLERTAVNPGCLIDPEKRAAYARKWAARLRREYLPRVGQVRWSESMGDCRVLRYAPKLSPAAPWCLGLPPREGLSRVQWHSAASLMEIWPVVTRRPGEDRISDLRICGAWRGVSENVHPLKGVPLEVPKEQE